MITEVELIHPGGERKTVPVEVIQPLYITVRWGMSGLYDINLRTNEMVSRSVAARRKGRCYWKLSDLKSVRKAVAAYLYPDKEEEMRKRYETHMNTMPKKAGLELQEKPENVGGLKKVR